MATSQMHGKLWENDVKIQRFNVSVPIKSNSKSDIPAELDNSENKIDTSIKSKKKTKNDNEVIECADARNFFSLKELRLILGVYDQKENIKSFFKVHEYEISHEEFKKIKGSYNESEMLSDVERIHNRALSFEKGNHLEARKEIKKEICKFYEKYPNCKIRLNQKIGSGNQRRVQCSIVKSVLEQEVKEKAVFTDYYGQIQLPVEYESPSRKFN